MNSPPKKYWLKIRPSFFEDRKIRIIEGMDNGKEYVLLYIKMMVESAPSVGSLRVSENIPYTDRTLAAAMNTNIDTVRSALRLFEEFGLVEIRDDRTIFLPEAAANIDSESVGAERVRRCRERKALQTVTTALQCNASVTNCNAPCNVSGNTSGNADEEKLANVDYNNVGGDCSYSDRKAVKKSVNVDKINVRDDCPYSDIAKLWNTVCTAFTPIENIKGSRREAVNARWKEYKSLEVFERLFKMIQSSKFLKTELAQKWAKFDWFMIPEHFIKTLEGNYGNIKQSDSSFDIDEVMESVLSQYE